MTDDTYSHKIDGEEYWFHNCKVLKCTDCKNQFVSDTTIKLCEVAIEYMKQKNLEHRDLNFEKTKNSLLKNEFISTEVDFIFDKDDYYFIPGLIRPWNHGFLTPVFFNIEVLLKYAYHPNYSLELEANTLGSIYKNQEHMINFGINPNGKVIMWLGDIGRLEVEEQHYLRSENIESDHNISSEFYEAEIESMWANPSNVKTLLKNRYEVHEKILRKFGTTISQLEPETIKVVLKVKRPLVPTEESFAEVIIPMNKIFVESINNHALKKDLKQIEGIDIKDKK
ncbi:hypothetical protein [Desulfurispora thermophila]|uniref:hypothetical protein n=1 Tax=Desulfurispora thermophila TaxID=265470 RepID=UPI000366D859|nr:hypothetical protein [Desulfurispora thermophila]